jgi:hypothetical protein
MAEERVHWPYSTSTNLDRQGSGRRGNRRRGKLERLGRGKGEGVFPQSVAEEHHRVPFAEQSGPPAKSRHIRIEVQIPCDRSCDGPVPEGKTIGRDVAARQLLRIAEIHQQEGWIQFYRANRKSLASLEQKIVVEHTAPEILHFFRDRVLRRLSEVPCGCAGAQGEVEAALPRLPGQELWRERFPFTCPRIPRKNSPERLRHPLCECPGFCGVERRDDFSRLPMANEVERRSIPQVCVDPLQPGACPGRRIKAFQF